MDARGRIRRVATAVAAVVLLTLVALDIEDAPLRLWFYRRSLTASALVSLLVLLITVLGVDEVLRLRSQRDRARVIGAQAVILGHQAQLTAERVRPALTDPESRAPAFDELRTYMTMLLVSAPVLVDSPTARAFLEDAQRLAGLLSHALENADDGRRRDASIDAALHDLDISAAPLVAALDAAELTAVDADPYADADTDTDTGPAPRRHSRSRR